MGKDSGVFFGESPSSGTADSNIHSVLPSARTLVCGPARPCATQFCSSAAGTGPYSLAVVADDGVIGHGVRLRWRTSSLSAAQTQASFRARLAFHSHFLTSPALTSLKRVLTNLDQPFLANSLGF